MSGVDNRVVTMTFDNKLFQQKVAETIGSLDKLKTALSFDAQKKAFDDISAASGKFNLKPMETSIESINAKFAAMATVGITALSNITNKAVDAGLRIGKSLTLDQVISGFNEYETNLNSVQTILSNTASKGGNLETVNAALDQLNTYSDQTIYNFSEMARNIGTFTAAGVGLETSVKSIKGIANLAALSGSSSEQASTAMYQLSQAIAAGSVKLMDWNSVVNAGMGGEIFQKALFESGKAMKTLSDVPMDKTFEQWTDGGKSFRETLQDGWITADVLTTTLDGMSGDASKAELMLKGFSEAQANNLIEIGRQGKEAATNIKTITQLFGVMKESVGSGFAQSFRLIIGDFQEAKSLFSGINQVFGKMISDNADARNQMLAAWRAFGGRELVLGGLFNAFHSLVAIIRPIKEAFREIFPPSMAANLVLLSFYFAEFSKKLIISGETADKIKTIFKGVFSIFSIGIAIIKGIFSVFSKLVSALFGLSSGAGGGFLTLIAGIAAFITKIQELVVASGFMEKAFSIIGTILVIPIRLLTALKDAIGNLVSSLGGFGGIFSGVISAFKSFGAKIAELFGGIDELAVKVQGALATAFGFLEEQFDNLLPVISRVIIFLQGAASAIGDFFSNLFGGAGDKAAGAASTIDKVSDSVSGLSISFGWLGTVMEAIGDAWDWLVEKIGSFDFKLDENMDKIGGAFSAIGEKIGDAFKDINWDQVLDFAKVGLAGGLLVTIKKVIQGLSFDQIFTGGMFGSISDSFGQLTSTLKAMETQIKAEALKQIAIAMAILVASMVLLTFIDIADLGKALGTMAIGFAQLTAVMVTLDKATSGGIKMLALSTGILILAAAMNVMVLAVTAMGAVPWDVLWHGLVGLGVGMIIMVGALNLIPKDAVKRSVGLLALSFAIQGVARVVNTFAGMDWEEMKQGFLGLGLSLAILAVAMRAMPQNMKEISRGLLLVAISLGIVVGVVALLGGMDTGVLAQGLIGIAAALLFIAVATTAMEAALPGAQAIAIVAGSLVVLAGVLILLGNLKLEQLLMGLLGIAAVVVLIATLATILSPVIPLMAALGAALLLVGAGFALFGLGVALAAAGFLLFALADREGVGNIIKAINMVIEAIPGFVERFVGAFTESVDSIVSIVPEIIRIFSEVFDKLLDLIQKYIPRIVDVIIQLAQEILRAIREIIPDLVETGVAIIFALLGGIRDNIDNIVTVGFEILQNLLDSILENIPLLVGAGVDIILAFIQGIADNIQQVIDAGVNILIQFLFGITRDVIKIAEAVGTVITALITAFTAEAIRIAQAGTDALIAFLAALTEDIVRIAGAITTLITTLITEIGNNSAKIVDAGTQALITFLDALSTNITEITPHVQTLLDNIFTEMFKLTQTFIDNGVAFVKKFMEEVAGAADEIMTGVKNFLVAILTSAATKIIELTNEIAAVVIAFLNGMAEAIENNSAGIAGGIKRIVRAIVSGMAQAFGLDEMQRIILEAAKDLLGWMYDIFMKLIDADSPSKVYMGVGKFMVQGLARGLTKSKEAEDAVKNLASNTIDAFNNSMNKLVMDMADTEEFNPTITPVLDLTQVARDAKNLSNLVSMSPLSANLSLRQARTLARAQAQNVEATVSTPTGPTEVTFEQNIYAPTALSANDIYRATRSQIVLAKEELKIP